MGKKVNFLREGAPFCRAFFGTSLLLASWRKGKETEELNLQPVRFLLYELTIPFNFQKIDTFCRDPTCQFFSGRYQAGGFIKNDLYFWLRIFMIYFYFHPTMLAYRW